MGTPSPFGSGRRPSERKFESFFLAEFLPLFLGSPVDPLPGGGVTPDPPWVGHGRTPPWVLKSSLILIQAIGSNFFYGHSIIQFEGFNLFALIDCINIIYRL